MSGKDAYLERYTVAPPPRRDYYGLRILGDEVAMLRQRRNLIFMMITFLFSQVILYLWKISHGPHRTPIVDNVKFIDFHENKLLQEEIRRVFGEHTLKYAKEIAHDRGRTLLTLPRSVIRNISAYLGHEDSENLRGLSRIASVVFDDDYEIHREKRSKSRTRKGESNRNMSYNWKQLFKEKQMRSSIGDQKTRPIHSSAKSRPSVGSSKTRHSMETTARSEPANFSEHSYRNPVNDVVRKSITSKVDRDALASELSLEEERTRKKKSTRKKNDSSVTEGTNGKRVAGNEVEIETILNVKRDARELSSSGSRRQPKASSVSSASLRSRCEKSLATGKTGAANASKTSDRTRISDAKVTTATKKSAINEKKSSSKTISTTSRSTQDAGRPNKPQTCPKSKIRPKKIAESKSTILSTEKSPGSPPSALSDTNLELKNLIEASLKKLRSPRSIFDYDFSCLEGSGRMKAPGKSSDEGAISRKKKSAKKDVDCRSFGRPGRRKYGRSMLDRLSEESDSLNARSSDSMVDASKRDSSSLLGERDKGRKGYGTRGKSYDSETSDSTTTTTTTTTRSIETFEKITDVYEELSSRRKANDSSVEVSADEEKDVCGDNVVETTKGNAPIPRGALNNFHLVRSLNRGGKTMAASRKSATTIANQFAVRKTLQTARKERVREGRD